MRFALSLAAVAALPFAASLVINDELLSFCKSPVVAQQSYIGDVKMSAIQCANFMSSGFVKRQQATAPNSTNVCGARCDTHCFNPRGGGPDPNDCNVIADALRYDSQDISEEFNITTDNALFVLQYRSCQSFFVNQAGTADLTYCRSDWAAVIDWVAFNCQAPQNAHGGLCVAASQQWFIQIQPFVNASESATTETASSTTSSASVTTPIIPPITTETASVTSSLPSTTTPSSSATTSSASSTATSPSSSATSSSPSSSATTSVTTTGSVTTEASTSVSTETATSTETSSSSSSTETSTATSASTTTSASVSVTTTSATTTTTA